MRFCSIGGFVNEQQCTILVVGATGYFGSLLVRELATRTSAHCVLAGRHEPILAKRRLELKSEFGDRWSHRRVDLNDARSVNAALDGIDITICAAGPFQGMSTVFARACMDRNIHWIDFADDRTFISEVRRFAMQQSESALRTVVCTGWSTLPALTSILARIAVADVTQVDSIEIEMAPGNRAPRAPATISALLSSISTQFTIQRGGQLVEVHGWSDPQTMTLPDPIGKRTGYLINAPEYDLFPRMFNARNVTFCVGSEIAFQNWLVSGLAWMSTRGIVKDWSRYVGPLRAGMAMFGFLGSQAGAIGVRISGMRADKTPVSNQATIVAHTNGQAVPILPAVVMTQMLIENSFTHNGLVPYDTWVSRDLLEAQCKARGYELVVDSPCHAKDDH